MSPLGPLGSALLLIASSTHCPAANPSTPGAVATSAQSMSCPRPTDSEGAPLYQSESGTFVARKTSEGGGRFVEISPPGSQANRSLRVTEEVYRAVESLERDRKVTLFGYVKAAMSGAEPPYSCIEF